MNTQAGGRLLAGAVLSGDASGSRGDARCVSWLLLLEMVPVFIAAVPSALKALCARRKFLGGYISLISDPAVSGRGEWFSSPISMSSSRQWG